MISDIRNIVLFDLETSGLEVENHQILEIGGIKCEIERLSIVEQFQTLIFWDKKKYRFDEQARKVNQITHEMLLYQPPIEDVLDDFSTFIGEKTALMAYNAHF